MATVTDKPKNSPPYYLLALEKLRSQYWDATLNRFIDEHLILQKNEVATVQPEPTDADQVIL